MGCCGNSRREYHNTPAQTPAATQATTPATAPASNPVITPDSVPAATQEQGRAGLPSEVYYEYVGATTITVRGSATGNIYRFRHSGHRVGIDPRDVPSLDMVPHLRRT